jgi:3-hydroxybutyryl-CoA dehydratase
MTTRIFDNIKLDQALPERVYEVDQRVITRNAAASLDFNPIHVNPKWAKKVNLLGRGSTIAHGMCTMSFMTSVITDWCYSFGGFITKIKSKFIWPVFPGDTITCRGVISALHPRNEGPNFVMVELNAENQDGTKVAVARVQVRLSDKLATKGERKLIEKPTNIEGEIRVEDFLKTKKQKAFEHDFFKNAKNYANWDTVDLEKEGESEKVFEVEVEDIQNFSEGILDANPLFNDEEAAKNGPFGGLIAHPIFITPIGFWMAGDSGPASWVRTPGAINPGQIIEFYEPVRPGDIIRVKGRFHDKYIKRDKKFLTFETDYIRQDDTLVCRWWITLILPQSKGKEEHQF